MSKITNYVYNIGVYDREIDLFEGQYPVKNGIKYNSYLIEDEKICILDTVDNLFVAEWMNNIKQVLNGKVPNYLVIHHVEPDHSSGILELIKTYPSIHIVGNIKTFSMIEQFYNIHIENKLVVKENDVLNLGYHQLKFIFAPMVHWPEVMMSIETTENILFSADAFGKFENNQPDESWDQQARRYYYGIVGKFGPQVQAVLKKVQNYQIDKIFSLHGEPLTSDIGTYVNFYQLWSTYSYENDGILIAYNSIYGNTKKAVETLVDQIKKVSNVDIETYDLARSDVTEVVGKAFYYKNLLLASPTYNCALFPFMDSFINHLLERNYQNRRIGIIDNGSWGPMSEKIIKDKFSNSKNITFLEPVVKIKSSLKEENMSEMSKLINALLDQ